LLLIKDGYIGVMKVLYVKILRRLVDF